MSEKVDEFYKYNNTIGLVTNASYIIQNLALLNTEDYYKADCLAVAHEGFINYIPLVNSSRRCKYVPICGGCDRGKGIIKWTLQPAQETGLKELVFNSDSLAITSTDKLQLACIVLQLIQKYEIVFKAYQRRSSPVARNQMKWLKINNDTYFICLSTIGIQFYDVELTDVQFEFDFKELNGRLSLPLGACVLGDTLFVGAAMGMIAMFQSSDECVRMVNHVKVSTFLYLDGTDDCLVTVAREEMKSYRIEDGKLSIVSVLKETLLLYSILKIFKQYLFIGDHTGELSLMSFPNLDIIVKQKLHDGEIAAIDYSNNKQILLSVADDLKLKAWKLNTSQRNWDCVFEVKSEDRPYCGIGFTNRNCTEFCCVKSNSLIVTFYIENNQKNLDDSSDEDSITDIETVPI